MSQYRPADYRNTGPESLPAVEAIPLSERGLPPSTYQLFCDLAERYEDRVALRFLIQGTPEETPAGYSYRELCQRITQTANALHHLGVGPTDTIGILLPNLPQTEFALWGGEAAGIINPINPLLEVEHIAAILNDTACPVLITLAPFPGTELWQKALELKTQVPSLHTIITVDPAVFLPAGMRDAIDQQRGSYLGDGVVDFDTFISQYNSDGLDSGRQITNTDIASYFHTGGTTGTPKLAPHNHLNELACAFQISTACNMEEGYVILIGLPLFHVNAVFTGLSAWMCGGEVLLATPQGYRTPEVMKNFWPLVEKYRVTLFSAVPTILTGLLNFPTTGFDLSSLKFAVCGAAPLATELARQFERQTGLVLVEGYGQTEGTCVSTLNPRFGDRFIGSVGARVPYMGIRIVEVDEKTGALLRDCDTNEAGIIAISGPNVFNGYKHPEQNEGQWIEPGWFNTGDLGRLDERGYLWLTGRSKDLIIRGGHNIDPQMIEEALFQHDAVAAAAAVGKPDPRVGELPAAYVQLKPGADVSETELLAFCEEHIPERAAIPKRILFIDAMPLTAVGKIFKPDLRNHITELTVSEVLAELGVKSYGLNVRIDKQHGQAVTVTLTDSSQADAVKEALGQYAFKSEVG